MVDSGSDVHLSESSFGGMKAACNDIGPVEHGDSLTPMFEGLRAKFVSGSTFASCAHGELDGGYQ